MTDATQLVTEDRRRTLVGILLRQIDLSPENLATARSAAEKAQVPLETTLVELGLVEEAQIALATAEYLGLPAVSLAHFSPDPELMARIPRRVVRDLRVLPLAKWGSALAVSLADPYDVNAVDELSRLIDEEVLFYVAPQSEVKMLLEQLVGAEEDGLAATLRDVGDETPEINVQTRDDDDLTQEDMLNLSEQEPVIRIVNSMLVEAIERRVSDIHIEPMENTLQVRYRIDGVLYDQPQPPKYMQWAILSRLKIIAMLDIAQRRLPQDGRFSVRIGTREADVRLNFVPTVHGQKAVLRILDKANLRASLSELKLDPPDYLAMSTAIRNPSGIILVTGPTGSGKTTTLYSVLQELNKPEVNIVTVEDPVEYQLARINQIATNPGIGLNFAEGMRAVLRQDPDVIMIGEIRDSETASTAVQASLTGHLVLSTLHANSAPAAVARLIHMGIEPFLIASSLRLSQAQRIYRRLCTFCKRPQGPEEALLAAHAVDDERLHNGDLQGPVGCSRCGKIGYRGRQVVMEILVVSPAVRELIVNRASTDAITELGCSEGMRTLRDAGLERAIEGETSLEEILRVTSND